MASKKLILCDRNILIELSKNNPEIIKELKKYTLAYNLDVPDSLIAATARYYNLELYTLNTKDFRFIEGLNLYKNSIQS